MPLNQIAFDFENVSPAPVVQETFVAVIEAPAMETVIEVVDLTASAEPTPKKKKENNKQLTRGRMSLKDMDAGVDLIEVPEDEVLFQKLYYPIGVVADMFKVNQSLIRFWENEFDILQPRKTRKGDRLFRVEDVKNLQLIYFLLRQRKFSIEGAKNYLKNNKAQADMQAQLVQSLTKFKSFLLELKSNLTA